MKTLVIFYGIIFIISVGIYLYVMKTEAGKAWLKHKMKEAIFEMERYINEEL